MHVAVYAQVKYPLKYSLDYLFLRRTIITKKKKIKFSDVFQMGQVSIFVKYVLKFNGFKLYRTFSKGTGIVNSRFEVK